MKQSYLNLAILKMWQFCLGLGFHNWGTYREEGFVTTGSNNGEGIHSIVDSPSLHSLHSVAKLWHLQMLPRGGAIFFCNVHNTQASWSYELCDNVLWSASLPCWLNTYSARKHWIWPPKMPFFSANVMWHTQQAIVVHEYKIDFFNKKTTYNFTKNLC